MTSVKPIVTWLLCTNKCDALLFRAIDSCFSQSIDHFNLLIVVNGVDHVVVSASILARYSDPRLKVVTTSITFLNFSLNLGIHYIDTEFVARMDADDVADFYRLEKQVSYLRKNHLVSLVGSYYYTINDRGEVVALKELPCSDLEIRAALHYGNPICHPSIMFRRELVAKNGGYLGGLHSEDYDLWVRLSHDKKILFANIPEPLTSYCVTGGDARGSRKAYISNAATQFHAFLATGRIKWLLASWISIGKLIFLSK